MSGAACFAIASAVTADLARVGHAFMTPGIGSPKHWQQLQRFTPNGGGGGGGSGSGGACTDSCSRLGIGAGRWSRGLLGGENKVRFERCDGAVCAVDIISMYELLAAAV